MILVKKVYQNVKKGPTSYQKNEMLNFGLCSTSDDWLSDEVDQNGKKKSPNSSKNEMPIFGLRSTSDDQPSDPSNESQLKCEKGPLSHQKMKCSILDYFQLLMISQAIRAMKVDKNAPPKCLRMTWNGQFFLIHNFSH